ncbi:MAG: CsgG/HfaB family protein [Deltaproteobacteria bacterium]|nr:CsgG/HfaB family protein [Deltaproteobacteria bacterium]
MKMISTIVLCIAVILGSTVPALCESLDTGLADLTIQITDGMAGQSRSRIAVIEFSDLHGNVTEFGKYVAEELTTRLFMTRKFHVVERQLINKVAKEHEFNLSGMVDPETAKSLGKILGVDAICSGTVTDLVSMVKLNARVIGTETGSIISVASVGLQKTDDVIKLMGSAISVGGRKVGRSGNAGNSTLAFSEDFSSYNEGDPTNWGRNVYVKKLRDGNKYLVTSIRGRHTVGQDVLFPNNFFFQFDFKDWAEKTNIVFIDAKGKRYHVKWRSNGNHFTFPNGATNRKRIEGEKNVRIEVFNGVAKAFIDGKFAITAPLHGYGQFVRFEIDVPLDRQGRYIAFTNFKIGTL